MGRPISCQIVNVPALFRTVLDCLLESDGEIDTILWNTLQQETKSEARQLSLA